MELLRGVHNLRSATNAGCVATIGNFDGVHRGHQQILQRVQQQAAAQGLRSLVMLFEPQPAEFFRPEQAPPRLMSLRDKARTLASLGVDQLYCVGFDEAFRSQSAAAFVADLLVAGLGCRYLVVGDDFRFGAGREGDFAYLQRAGEQWGFGVEDTPTCELDGRRVSSTWVREALAAGDLALAERLLGRPYRVSGRVRHGDKIGRTLGVPTANLPQRRRPALTGVYAVTVEGPGLKQHPGVASVGMRPTVNGRDWRLEVHLLDYQGDLYGRHLDVTFCHYLRPELKFDTLPALTAAMQQDFVHARAWFAAAGLSS